MDLLIILTYSGFCVVVFKLFKIPLNKWSVPTAILGGVFILSTLLVLMNYNHPYGKFAKEVYITVPIVPAVKGHVISVAAKPNQKLNKGDILFEIDPKPYQFKVNELQAKLAASQQKAKKTGAELIQAQANLKKSEANRDLTLKNYQRYVKGNKSGGGVFSKKDVENRRQRYLAAQADVEAAQAAVNKARFDSESMINGTDTGVVQLQQQLQAALYDLERTTVVAPSDGIITQLALRPGSMAVPMPLRPAMIFIPTQKRLIAASFWQNSLQRMESGSEAEVILDAVPGKVFSGKLISVIPAMSEAEVQINNQLLSARQLSEFGQAIGLIELNENISEYNLPLGVQGKAAIYSEHFSHVSVMRKILIRMVGWLNYVYPMK